MAVHNFNFFRFGLFQTLFATGSNTALFPEQSFETNFLELPETIYSQIKCIFSVLYFFLEVKNLDNLNCKKSVKHESAIEINYTLSKLHHNTNLFVSIIYFEFTKVSCYGCVKILLQKQHAYFENAQAIAFHYIQTAFRLFCLTFSHSCIILKIICNARKCLKKRKKKPESR